jgi:hypothetical protein
VPDGGGMGRVEEGPRKCSNNPIAPSTISAATAMAATRSRKSRRVRGARRGSRSIIREYRQENCSRISELLILARGVPDNCAYIMLQNRLLKRQPTCGSISACQNCDFRIGPGGSLLPAVEIVLSQLQAPLPMQGEQLDGPVAIDRALKTSTLTQDGKPLYALMEHEEPHNQVKTLLAIIAISVPAATPASVFPAPGSPWANVYPPITIAMRLAALAIVPVNRVWMELMPVSNGEA